jgi:hypothetical protein
MKINPSMPPTSRHASNDYLSAGEISQPGAATWNAIYPLKADRSAITNAPTLLGLSLSYVPNNEVPDY